MGRFTAAGRAHSQAEQSHRQLRGKFECQECGTVSRVAYYDEDNAVLMWYCDKNHESKIGGFHV